MSVQALNHVIYNQRTFPSVTKVQIILCKKRLLNWKEKKKNEKDRGEHKGENNVNYYEENVLGM